MILIRRTALVTVASCAALAASAQELPRYDVEGPCRQSGIDLHRCVDYAQGYYDFAKSAWPSLTADERAKCIQASQQPSRAQYIQLGTCVQATLIAKAEAERRKEPPRFRY